MPSKQNTKAGSGYNYNEPAWVEDFLAADIAKQLSTAHRQAITSQRQSVQMTEQELASNFGFELNPAVMQELNMELARTSDPQIHQILSDEKNNLLHLVQQAEQMKQEIRQQEQAKAQKSPPSFMDKISGILSNLWSTK